MNGAKEHRLWQIPPSEIAEDPNRFQSRAEYPRDVRDCDLDDASRFNEDFAGVISVWRDTDSATQLVIDGHRRLRLAKRCDVPFVWTQFLQEHTAADAFAKGVTLNLAQWAFTRGDELVWAIASRRAAVERALHTRWLDADGEAAVRLYEYYPDLGRRYSAVPEDYTEAARG